MSEHLVVGDVVTGRLGNALVSFTGKGKDVAIAELGFHLPGRGRGGAARAGGHLAPSACPGGATGGRAVAARTARARDACTTSGRPPTPVILLSSIASLL